MRVRSKPFASYLASLPDQRLEIVLQAPNGAVKDYAEGEFDSDLVVVGAVIDGQPYVDGFEMTPEVKDVLMNVRGGKAVKVVLVADDSDSDFFPSVESAELV